MSLFARTAWWIVAGFVALELIVHAVFLHDRTVAAASAYTVSVVDRALALLPLVADADDEERAHLFAASDGPGFRASLQGAMPAAAGPRWRHADEIERAVTDHLERVSISTPLSVAVFSSPAERGPAEPSVRIVAPLDGGAYLVVTATGIDQFAGNRPVLQALALTLLVALVVLWGARRSTRHVQRFAAAAEALGRDIGSPPLPETGPRDVRAAAIAFNAMARRVRGHIEDRAQMLAAVSHDVRTLLTKLSLRIDEARDFSARDRAREDIVQMTALLDDVVTFVKEERAEEPRQRIDVATLAATLVDDERSLGRAVTYAGDDHAVVEGGRASALRRAITNVIDNAVRYAGSAEVSVRGEAGHVAVEIADRGPGIPLDARERVLKPFERLERSRNESTGGSGLGLAIARAVVVRHGGSFLLDDRVGGGLVVRMVLPCAAPAT